MRWFFRTLVITVVVISAYTAWPIYGLAQLGEAFRSRDVAQINNLVDFPALQRSIAAQIIATYLKMTGQDAAMGQLGSSLAVGIGLTLADAEVERIVSPEGLLMLFERGQVADLPASAIAPSMQIDVGKAFKLWTDADYGGQRVFFLLPPTSRVPSNIVSACSSAIGDGSSPRSTCRTT